MALSFDRDAGRPNVVAPCAELTSIMLEPTRRKNHVDGHFRNHNPIYPEKTEEEQSGIIFKRAYI